MEAQEYVDKKANGYYAHFYLSAPKNSHVHNQQVRPRYFQKFIQDHQHIKKGLLIVLVILCSAFTSPNMSLAQIGIWTSAQELADIPMSGPAWDAVKNAADIADPNAATVSDQNSNNNVRILAAAIVLARTGIQSYKDKVVAALEKLVSEGMPGAHTLAWARETGAYVMAADLVDYRTTDFED